MKTVLNLSALAASLLATAAMAQTPEIIRGALPANLAQLLRPAAPIQVATCPAGFAERFANQKLSCERHIVQRDDVKCPSSTPNYVARNVSVGTDRDICTKAGVVITSDGSLTNFRNGVDYVFIPGNGERNGVSFLAHHPSVTPSDGWHVNTNNNDSNGIADRYERTLTIKATPILVNP